jgi:alkylhydroperoxidase family enzyme
MEFVRVEEFHPAQHQSSLEPWVGRGPFQMQTKEKQMIRQPVSFTYHTRETAPAESKPLIDQTITMFGFLPNLSRVMAEAPLTYEVFNVALSGFSAKSAFSPLEQQIVMMTANFENRCHYCTAAHSMVMTMQKMPGDVIAALRDGAPLADDRLEALRVFTHSLIKKRGYIGDDGLQRFLDAGYSKRQALEVLTGLAAKLITNFTNALAHTELDEPVKAFAWTHPDQRERAATAPAGV